MSLFRRLQGWLVYQIGHLFTLNKVKRNPLDQASVDRETSHLTLYSYRSCVPCAKVHKEIKRLNLEIDVKDVNRAYCYRNDLIKGGGRLEVPCLHIREENREEWMYDSESIAAYLNSRFNQEEFKSRARA